MNAYSVRSRFLWLILANCWAGGMALSCLIYNVIYSNYLMTAAGVLMVAASVGATWRCLRFVQ